MASFYELSEEEVEFLIKCLDVWYISHPGPTPEDLKEYMDLRHYFMERERR